MTRVWSLIYNFYITTALSDDTLAGQPDSDNQILQFHSRAVMVCCTHFVALWRVQLMFVEEM